MFDIPKSDRDYYESQDKEQLIVLLLNEKRENELLHKTIHLQVVLVLVIVILWMVLVWIVIMEIKNCI